VSGTLLEDRSMFYCCRRHNFALEALLLNTEYFYIADSDTLHRSHCCVSITTVVTRTRHSVTLCIITWFVLYKFGTLIYISHEHLTLAFWYVLENVRCLCSVLTENRLYPISVEIPQYHFMKIRLAVLELFRMEMHTDRHGEEHGRSPTTVPHWIVVLAELTHHRTRLAKFFWRWVPKLSIKWELGGTKFGPGAFYNYY
jgi:hypothetical protein